MGRFVITSMMVIGVLSAAVVHASEVRDTEPLYLNRLNTDSDLVNSEATHGKINVFTDHQIISMVAHRVHNPYAPTGTWPYIGRIGLEYERQHWTYSVSYIHRSNADIAGNEYNYDGVSFGIKYSHCIFGC